MKTALTIYINFESLIVPASSSRSRDIPGLQPDGPTYKSSKQWHVQPRRAEERFSQEKRTGNPVHGCGRRSYKLEAGLNHEDENGKDVHCVNRPDNDGAWLLT